MIEDQVVEIQRLLRDAQLSQRAIAARVGVSRGLVAAVAAGRRSPNTAAMFERRFAALASAADVAAGYQRCPACGGLVVMPCRLCSLRAAIRVGGRFPCQEDTRYVAVSS